MIKKTCINCGKEFETYECYIKRGGGKYCSGSCRRSYLNKVDNPAKKQEVKEKISQNHANVSGKRNPMYGKSGEKAPNYKDGRSKQKGRVYRRIMLANSTTRSCIICGENNLEMLDVHHRDGNRQHNDLENLFWLCKNCHRTHAHEILRDEKGRITGVKLKEVAAC